MPASEDPGSGPVIHDHRRIDPVTGQVRGKHAASKPAGTTVPGRPGLAVRDRDRDRPRGRDRPGTGGSGDRAARRCRGG